MAHRLRWPRSLIALVWIVPADAGAAVRPVPVADWLAWNAGQFGLPSWTSIKSLLPHRHLVLLAGAGRSPAGRSTPGGARTTCCTSCCRCSFVGALTLLVLCDPAPENGDLLKLLPPLAIMAAFGLPTMKRGAINAIDWFSVMVLTMIAAVVWLFWIAKLTGWPAQFAKNVLKLLPGFKPEFRIIAVPGRRRATHRLDLPGALARIAPAIGAVARGGAVVGRPDPAVGAADDAVPARPELQQELRAAWRSRSPPRCRRQRLHRHQRRPGAARLVRLLRRSCRSPA